MSYMKITRDDNEIEAEISGSHCGAELDVGIMGDYFEDICAVNAYGVQIELTEDEEQRANEILTQNHYDSYPEFDDNYL